MTDPKKIMVEMQMIPKGFEALDEIIEKAKLLDRILADVHEKADSLTSKLSVLNSSDDLTEKNLNSSSKRKVELELESESLADTLRECSDIEIAQILAKAVCSVNGRPGGLLRLAAELTNYI